MSSSIPPRPEDDEDFEGDDSPADHADRTVGELIAEVRDLPPDQIERIVAYQREHNVRFGEAAVALNLVSSDEVVQALSRQFHYPYSVTPPQAAESTELVAATNPFSDQAERFRELRSQLIMGVAAHDQPRRALAVVSPEIGDGKTFIAANLAVSFSQLGERTLLIDGDMRTPRLHLLFGFDQSNGLSNLLSGRSGRSVIQEVDQLPALYVMPVGAIPPNPSELLQRATFEILLQQLLTRFDRIVVDTPAAKHGSDAQIIAAKSGAVIVVGRKRRSRLSTMQALLTKLGKGPGVVAGVVMNDY
jgi:chain length determinant protein tyrosine kinase EpsG